MKKFTSISLIFMIIFSNFTYGVTAAVTEGVKNDVLNSHLPRLRRYSVGFVRPLVLQPDPPAPHRGPAAGVGGRLPLPPYSPCLPPRGKVAPQGRMRGRPPAAAHSRATRRGRRPRRPAKPPANGHPPGSHPRRGQDPSPTDRTIDGCPRNPPGRACPAPTARRPGNGCPRKPHSVSISPHT